MDRIMVLLSLSLCGETDKKELREEEMENRSRNCG